MQRRVKGHKRRLKNKVVSVREHKRRIYKRKINSSFLEYVKSREGGGYCITIQGRDYPYPFLPKSKVDGLIRGHGRYYNKHIRGRYF